MLENVHYIGCVRWNWRKTIKIIEDQEIKKLRPKAKVNEYLVFNGKHEGIVSEELFNKAREIRGQRHHAKTDTTLKNPLSGVMVCKRCGAKIGYNTYVRKGVEFAKPKLKYNNQVHCKSGSADFAEVMERICDSIRGIIDDYEIRVEYKQDDSVKLHKSLVEGLEKKLNDLEIKEALQWETKQHPDPDERMPSHIFKQSNEKLLKEKEEINEALCKAKESMPEPINYKEQILKFTDALEKLEDSNVDATVKNRHLKNIIERIEYDRPPTVKITNENIHLYNPERKKGVMFHTEPYEISIIIK